MSLQRPRILFYVHDDRGLGHLVRLSRVATGLQEDCACLLVTGHKEASWIVPGGCDFVRIPGLDNLLRDRSAYWGRRPLVDMLPAEAVHFRSQLLSGVLKGFEPDAIIIDHLSKGKHGELSAALSSSRALKYLLLRGVIDSPAKATAEVFPAGSLELVDKRFARILVACDTKICRIEDEYLGSKHHQIAGKINYTGYVAPSFSIEERNDVRRQREVGANTTWVVCSAGGGMESEHLITECQHLAHAFPNVVFDVVYGPRARGEDQQVAGRGNLRSWPVCKQLSLFHASADVVICRGGYNTLMEVAAGNAKIICIPLNLVDDKEQLIHASRLTRWLPVHISSADRKSIASILTAILKSRQPLDARSRGVECGLNFDGVQNIRRIVLDDLARVSRRRYS